MFIITRVTGYIVLYTPSPFLSTSMGSKEKKMSTHYFKFKQTFTRWASKPVTCPVCLNTHTLREFQAHVTTVHRDVNAKLSCIFCLGQFTWTRGDTQTESVNVHRLKCIKFLAHPYKVNPKRKRTHEEEDGFCATCDEPLKKIQRKTLRGRIKEERWDRFYESSVGTLLPCLSEPRPPDHVAFSEESGLGDDIHPIFKHFQRNKDYQWYHVMVKAAVWNDFEREILSLHDVFVVPYGCLCDSSHKSGNDGVHHRHMILVVHEKSHFLRVWRQQIKLPKREKAKWSIKIQTEEHLSNVLYYVSNPKAHCDGIVKDAYDPFSGGSHYALERHMYPHAVLAMATLYRKGLQQYVHRRARHLDPTPWFEHVTVRKASRNDEQRNNNPRVVAIRHLGLPIRGCHLPLAKHVRFGSDVMTLGQDPPGNRPFLWMYGNDQYVLLETGVTALEQAPFDTWRRHQRERGNAFLEALQDEEYVLGLNHVKTVAMLKRFSSSVQEKERGLREEMKSAWNKEVAEHQRTLAIKEATWEKKEREMLEEIQSLKEKINTTESRALDQLQSHRELVCDTEKNMKQMVINLEARVAALQERMDYLKANQRNSE